jgi:hypothetical protein
MKCDMCTKNAHALWPDDPDEAAHFYYINFNDLEPSVLEARCQFHAFKMDGNDTISIQKISEEEYTVLKIISQ